jgi:DNA-binding transcriptional regulator YhcF (GntR family)
LGALGRRLPRATQPNPKATGMSTERLFAMADSRKSIQGPPVRVLANLSISLDTATRGYRTSENRSALLVLRYCPSFVTEPEEKPQGSRRARRSSVCSPGRICKFTEY